MEDGTSVRVVVARILELCAIRNLRCAKSRSHFVSVCLLPTTNIRWPFSYGYQLPDVQVLYLR